jgi:hypothetical protein
MCRCEPVTGPGRNVGCSQHGYGGIVYVVLHLGVRGVGRCMTCCTFRSFRQQFLLQYKEVTAPPLLFPGTEP